MSRYIGRLVDRLRGEKVYVTYEFRVVMQGGIIETVTKAWEDDNDTDYWAAREARKIAQYGLELPNRVWPPAVIVRVDWTRR